MSTGTSNGGTESHRLLGWWMVGVGIIYLLLAINLGSLLIIPERMYQFYPTYDVSLDSIATAIAADFAFMFALELAVIGIFLLWASRQPATHTNLVILIIFLELIRGIVDDIYLITMRTHVIDVVYYGFIVLHLAIIATGLYVYPKWTLFGIRPNTG